jgi:hypothetical protein
MARLAAVTSISPAQKRLKPPHVPDMPTDTRTSGETFLNS